MTKRMLIDTTHAEETRVVVMDGDRVEDYDVETSSRKQLKGNIYLAKVIRVEPSLQAAFVEYGGNRHGFLAFSEIHPDYFQIPVADREKLLALQEEELAQDARADQADMTDVEPEDTDEQDISDRRTPEIVGGEHDTGEDNATSRRTARFLRNYKIQEVIRRRQVLLVQVVKEERGNKGAALTTYISLAGRYCVLMPNALRGGGVSRKITSDADRKRLRDIIAELNLPRTMAMIIRTAGAGRPAPEVMRDCEYLLQLWDDIRSHALSSVAPTLVYEEASLIKRAIRDLFSKDIDDIMVDGEAAWRSAREFMRLLMPHNAGKVKLWQNRGLSLFAKHNVEGHLDAMFSPTARLKSGGYLVINQTEALVAIDVNSGKSTSQRNIEETALRTNLEAAEEVARQLRLRDLAGLVVIDFIDMESRRHNAQVEKRLKDALRTDRARIQVGHISHFGLLEMSRQRLRPSIAESLLTPCPHCQGTGFIRGTDSSALHVLRAIDEEGARQRAAEIEVYIGPSIALYILNNKRNWLSDIEQRHRMHVIFRTDQDLAASEMHIERLQPQTTAPMPTHQTVPQNVRTIEIIEEENPAAYQAQEPSSYDTQDESDEDQNGNRRRRRRRRRGRRDDRSDERHDHENGHERHGHETASHHADDQPSFSSPDDHREDEQDHDSTEVGLIPGRRRTRFKRVNKNDEQQEETPVIAQQEEQRAEPQRQEHAYAPREQRRDDRRHNRNRDNRNNRHDQPRHEQRRDRDYRREDRHEQRYDQRHDQRQDHHHDQRRAYAGPTPADPFGGSFDIFDVIEQAEMEQAARPIPTTVQQSEALSVQATPLLQAEAPSIDTVNAETLPEQPKRGRPRRNGRTANAAAETPAETAETVDATAKPQRSRSRRKAEPAETTAVETVAAEETTPEKPKRGRRPSRVAEKAEAAEDSNTVQPVNIDELPPAKTRKGWWKR